MKQGPTGLGFEMPPRVDRFRAGGSTSWSTFTYLIELELDAPAYKQRAIGSGLNIQHHNCTIDILLFKWWLFLSVSLHRQDQLL